jgi:hypothetical protein
VLLMTTAFRGDGDEEPLRALSGSFHAVTEACQYA